MVCVRQGQQAGLKCINFFCLQVGLPIVSGSETEDEGDNQNTAAAPAGRGSPDLIESDASSDATEDMNIVNQDVSIYTSF